MEPMIVAEVRTSTGALSTAVARRKSVPSESVATGVIQIRFGIVSILVALPAEIADSLLSDDVAVRALRGKAEPAVVAAVIEVIGATANLVTIAVAVPQIREVLARTIKWASDDARRANNSGDQAVKIVLANGESVTLTVNTRAEGALEGAAVRIVNQTQPSGKTTT